MSSIKDRIRQIIVREGLNAGAFAETIGVAKATISHILGSRNQYPSTQVLLRIHERYPDIDLNWLLAGEGHLGGDDDGLISPPTPPIDSTGSAEELEGLGLEVGVGRSTPSENAIFRPTADVRAKNRKENGSKSPQNAPKSSLNQDVGSKERPPRKITEILVFFDDNTFETYTP